MARLILMDQFHIAFLVPKGLNSAESELIWQAINDVSFRKDLRRAVRLLGTVEQSRTGAAAYNEDG